MPRFLDEDSFPDTGEYDPHCVRSRPVEDEEAEIIEAICQAATPGPLVTDDVSDGGGVLVATLPDGRNIVSLVPIPGGPEGARSMAAGNAQLICEARGLLLRLLRDRHRSKRRQKRLLKRIQALEERLKRQYEAVEQAGWRTEDPAPSHPR